jgi:hypothetical protein
MKLAPPKPALLHTKFLTSLLGPGGKMSASNPNSKIDMSDTPNQIKNKINRYGFSGGQETIELHRELGGNPDVDVAYQYLTYFEEDDSKIAKFYQDYKAGTMSTGEMKRECIAVVQAFVGEFQERRKHVTDDVLKEYMRVRNWRYRTFFLICLTNMSTAQEVGVERKSKPEEARAEATKPIEDEGEIATGDEWREGVTISRSRFYSGSRHIPEVIFESRLPQRQLPPDCIALLTKLRVSRNNFGVPGLFEFLCDRLLDSGICGVGYAHIKQPFYRVISHLCPRGAIKK